MGGGVFLCHPWKEAVAGSHHGSWTQGHHIKDGLMQKPPAFLEDHAENMLSGLPREKEGSYLT